MITLGVVFLFVTFNANWIWWATFGVILVLKLVHATIYKGE